MDDRFATSSLHCEALSGSDMSVCMSECMCVRVRKKKDYYNVRWIKWITDRTTGVYSSYNCNIKCVFIF